MKKKGIVYRRMLLSFVTAFILPICVTIFFYFFSRNVLTEQIEHSNANLLQTVQSVCDEEFRTYQSILQLYNADATVAALGSLNTTDGTEHSDYNELWKDLHDSARWMHDLQSGGQDVFVYFPKISRIVSSQERTIQLGAYLDQICADAQTKDTLNSFLNNVQDQSVIVLDSAGWGEDALLLAMRCWENDPGCDAVVGIWVDTKALNDKVAGVDWQYGFEWAVLDQTGRVIKSAQSISDEDILAYVQQNQKNERYLMTNICSQESGWQYVLCVPKEAVEDAAAPLRLFFTITMLLCVLLGVGLTIKLTNVNYRPIDSTLQLIQRKDSSARAEHGSKEQDEYQYIRRQVEKLVDSKRSLEKTLMAEGKKEKNWVLTNLLTKPDMAVEEKWQPLIAPFATGQNKVALIREMVFSGSGASGLDTSLKRFVVENVLTELLSKSFYCQIVDLDGFQAMIIHGECLDGMEEQLQELLQEFQLFLTENLQYAVTVATGGVHSGLNGIRASYLEARETEEFLAVLEQDYLEFEDVRDKALRKYSYSMQTEELVYRAVQNDNPELAAAFISRVLDEALADKVGSSFQIHRVMLADIYCTLLKAADEKGNLDKVRLTMGDIEAQTGLDGLKACFGQIVNSICKEESEAEKTSVNEELCSSILQYIQKNYCDPDLNVSKVALQFGVSPSALSSIYKKETGNSLLKVLNETRIENAARLLKKGCTVSDTAKKVGVIDSSSFIRLFKKHVGITPGQYKANFSDEH